MQSKPNRWGGGGGYHRELFALRYSSCSRPPATRRILTFNRPAMSGGVLRLEVGDDLLQKLAELEENSASGVCSAIDLVDGKASSYEGGQDIDTLPLFQCVFKTIPLTGLLASILSIEFIKHVSFMRKQIPCTYVDLERVAQEERARKAGEDHRKLRAGFSKNALHFVDTISDIFEGISLMFDSPARPSKFLILFGSTVTNPREGFLLDFTYTDDIHSYPYTSKQYNLSVRKLIRSLIQEGAAVFETDLRPMQLYFLAYGARISDTSGFGFVPQEHFNINTHGKRNRAPFGISIIGLQNLDIDDIFCDDPMGKVWYQWPGRLSGVKAPPNRKQDSGQRKRKSNRVARGSTNMQSTDNASSSGH